MDQIKVVNGTELQMLVDIINRLQISGFVTLLDFLFSQEVSGTNLELEEFKTVIKNFMVAHDIEPDAFLSMDN